jgi:hypothetical protein
MGRSLLEMLSQISSLALQSDRRSQAERRSDWRGGRRRVDFAGLSHTFPVPIASGRTARLTWVHDQDTLKEQYVN